MTIQSKIERACEDLFDEAHGSATGHERIREMQVGGFDDSDSHQFAFVQCASCGFTVNVEVEKQ